MSHESFASNHCHKLGELQTEFPGKPDSGATAIRHSKEARKQKKKRVELDGFLEADQQIKNKYPC